MTLFLDDGGVCSDNSLRGPQWGPLLGDFLAARLGGSAENWAVANLTIQKPPWDQAGRALHVLHTSIPRYLRAYRVWWLRALCHLVGVPGPPAEQALDIATGAVRYCTRHVRAAGPGAVGAIRRLHALGVPLHTASGEMSDELEGYLDGMGVRDRFGTLYGPDVVNVWKHHGAPYYAAIFAHAGVAPSHALVVDDHPEPIRAALAAGARAVLVTGLSGAKPVRGAGAIETLAELPAMVATLRGHPPPAAL